MRVASMNWMQVDEQVRRDGRRLLGDGNFHGVYQRPDAEMLALWDVAVAETRAVIAGNWRTTST